MYVCVKFILILDPTILGFFFESVLQTDVAITVENSREQQPP